MDFDKVVWYNFGTGRLSAREPALVDHCNEIWVYLITLITLIALMTLSIALGELTQTHNPLSLSLSS